MPDTTRVSPTLLPPETAFPRLHNTKKPAEMVAKPIIAENLSSYFAITFVSLDVSTANRERLRLKQSAA